MTDYTISKKQFCFMADSEARGINALCKIFASMYANGNREFIAILAHDCMTIDYLTSKEFLEVAKVYNPNRFNSKGEICRLTRCAKSDKERLETLSHDFESIDLGNEYDFILIQRPINKWSASELYNFAKTALIRKNKALKEAKKRAEDISKSAQARASLIASLSKEELETALANCK